jgi:hypothetical protein
VLGRQMTSSTYLSSSGSLLQGRNLTPKLGLGPLSHMLLTPGWNWNFPIFDQCLSLPPDHTAMRAGSIFHFPLYLGVSSAVPGTEQMLNIY